MFLRMRKTKDWQRNNFMRRTSHIAKGRTRLLKMKNVIRLLANSERLLFKKKKQKNPIDKHNLKC